MEPRRKDSGFTLLEVAIYTGILVLLGGPLVSMVLISTRATTENDTFNKVEERNRTAVFRMEREIRTALSGTPAVGDSGKSLTLTPEAGFDGTAVIAGDPIRFTLRYARDEAVDGSDDNGNGLADEGELVHADTVTGVETVICGGIDMMGSSFALNGTGVTLSVTSMGSLGSGNTFSISRSITVYPRN